MKKYNRVHTYVNAARVSSIYTTMSSVEQVNNPALQCEHNADFKIINCSSSLTHKVSIKAKLMEVESHFMFIQYHYNILSYLAE